MDLNHIATLIADAEKHTPDVQSVLRELERTIAELLDAIRRE